MTLGYDSKEKNLSITDNTKKAARFINSFPYLLDGEHLHDSTIIYFDNAVQTATADEINLYRVEVSKIAEFASNPNVYRDELKSLGISNPSDCLNTIKHMRNSFRI